MKSHWLCKNAALICDTLDNKAEWSIDNCEGTVWCDQIIIKRDADNIRLLIRANKDRVRVHVLLPKCEEYGRYTIEDCLPHDNTDAPQKWEISFSEAVAEKDPIKFARGIKSRLFERVVNVWPFVTAFIERHDKNKKDREELKDRLRAMGYKPCLHSDSRMYGNGLVDIDVCSSSSKVRVTSQLYVTEDQLKAINAILSA